MKYLKRFNEELFTPEDFIKPEVKQEVLFNFNSNVYV